MASDPPLFDPDQFNILLELCEADDLSLIEEVVTQFFNDLTPLMGRLHAAAASADFCVVADAAHTLKGSSAIFGMSQVEVISRELEKAARASDATGVELCRHQLCAAIQPGCESIRKHLASLKKT